MSNLLRYNKVLDRLSSKVTKKNHQCRSKIRHSNFWTAMQHAAVLDGFVAVYYCTHCEYAHVGHIDQDSVVWMMDGYSEKIVAKVNLDKNAVVL